MLITSGVYVSSPTVFVVSPLLCISDEKVKWRMCVVECILWRVVVTEMLKWPSLSNILSHSTSKDGVFDTVGENKSGDCGYRVSEVTVESLYYGHLKKCPHFRGRHEQNPWNVSILI